MSKFESTGKFNYSDLLQTYEKFTAKVYCNCVFATDFAGGQPASEEGVRAFVTHHLEITDPIEAEAAVRRILKEEVGERDSTPTGGEVPERESYGINVIRRSPLGPWIGAHQIQACIKQSASILNIFVDFKRSKGRFSEAGRVSAVGASLLEPDHPERIYIRNPENTGPAETGYHSVKGKVTTPQGEKSIVHDSECAVAGSRFEFEYRYIPGEVKRQDMQKVLALSMITGLGSCKALYYGKFRIDDGEFFEAQESVGKPKEPKPPKGKSAKPNGAAKQDNTGPHPAAERITPLR